MGVLMQFSCWEYGSKKLKPLLPRDSCHSKLVKQGVIFTTLSNALKKSCNHYVTVSLAHQVNRLLSSGYAFDLVITILASVHNHVFTQPVSIKERDSRPLLVIAYLHGATHSVLKIASKYNIRTVFSVRFKMSMLTPFSYSLLYFVEALVANINSLSCFSHCSKFTS